MNPQSPDSTDSRALVGGERRVLELIAMGAPLETSLDALCRFIDEESGLWSSIFLLGTSGEELRLCAGPHLPKVWREAVASFPITETACGAAVTQRKQIISPDIALDPRYAGYHDAARAAGIRAVWSTPFFSQHDRPLGTFAVYGNMVGPPSGDNLALVSRATRLASIAVGRQETEDRLRDNERRFVAAFYSSPGCLSISRLSDRQFMYVNDRFVTTFGYSRAEAIGRTSLDLGLYADLAQGIERWRMVKERRVQEFEAKARTKVGDMLHLLVWMECIELLGEETVLTVCCDITDRKRAEEALAQSERLLRTVLDTLPVGVLVVEAAGNILLSNPAAQSIWGEVIRSGPERYARSRAWWHETGRQVEPDEWASVRARVKGETSVNQVVDIDTFDGVRKVIRNSAVPIRANDGTITGAVIVNEDISAATSAERERNDALEHLRGLTAKLMHAQDDERRRIAQILHETTAQELAGLKMLLARLKRTPGGCAESEAILLDEGVQLADTAMTEVRTLSYLLYPPFLDETGLLSAVRWYARGFAERSGIQVDLDLPADMTRLPQDVETTLFRVVQEALINIHRHADSLTARIQLRIADGNLTLQIADRGKGMPAELVARLKDGVGAFGVGIASMRERLKQLGGALDINSTSQETVVRAVVPLGAAAS